MMLFNEPSLQEIVQPRLTMSCDLGRTWIAKASYGVFTQDVITISNEDDLITLFDAWIFLPKELALRSPTTTCSGWRENVLPSLALSLQAYAKHYGSLTLYNSLKFTHDDPDFINGSAMPTGPRSLSVLHLLLLTFSLRMRSPMSL